MSQKGCEERWPLLCFIFGHILKAEYGWFDKSFNQGRSYRVVPVVRGPPCAQPNQSSSVELGLERSACVPLGLLRTAFRHRPS